MVAELSSLLSPPRGKAVPFKDVHGAKMSQEVSISNVGSFTSERVSR
jgi:hypothetical protein